MHTMERALSGVRVLVTRPRAQAEALVAGLERCGAEAIVAPTTRVVGAEDPEPLQRAVERAGSYDWIVFTSVNGVRFFWEVFHESGLDAGTLEGVRFGCVGPSTAGALSEHGFVADAVPSEYVAEAVVDAVLDAEARLSAGKAQPLEGVRILLPLAAGARPVLAEGLAAHGAVVDRVEAYRSIPDTRCAVELRRRIASGEVDVITFTASSTVDSFVAVVGTEVGRAVVAAIGPITARTARRHGLPVEIVAEEYTIDGLLKALVRRFRSEPDAPNGV